MARGELEDAEVSFPKAVGVAPESLDAWLALANFLWASGQLEATEHSLRDAPAIDPTNLVANRALGVLYLATNRTPDAEPYFKAIADTEQTTAARISLADYHVMTRRFDDAHRSSGPGRQQTDPAASDHEARGHRWR